MLALIVCVNVNVNGEDAGKALASDASPLDPLTQPSNAKGRKSVPPPNELAVAKQSILQEFKFDFAKKSPVGRRELASKLLSDADQKKDNGATHFQMLFEAATLLGQSGEYDSALAAIDIIAATYSIDPIRFKIDIIRAASKISLSNQLSRSLAIAGTSVAEEASAQCAFVAAQEAVQITDGAVSRVTGDAAFAKGIRARLRQVRDLQQQYLSLQPSVEKLKSAPDDPVSNFKVGRFYALVLGDFEKGLPLLAKGSDPQLKKLALDEQSKTELSASTVSVADRWWDLGQRERAASATHCKDHAADLYRAAAPFVEDADESKRISMRMVKTPRNGDAVNLLEMLDLASDVRAGKWTADPGTLTSDNEAFARVEFPYQPPEEYDVRIVFSGKQRDLFIAVMLPKKDGFYTFCGNGPYAGFESFNGNHIADGGPTARTLKKALEPNKDYTLIIKVRQDRISAELNGEMVGEVDPSQISKLNAYSTWVLRNKASVGIGSYHSPLIFRKVELLEITGKGKRARQS